MINRQRLGNCCLLWFIGDFMVKQNKITDEEFEVIHSLCTKFSYNSYFNFPGYTRDDIYQEGWIICITMMGKYNKDNKQKASLKTFLYRVLYCRLCNLRRAKYIRHGTKTDYKAKVNNAEQLNIDMHYEADSFETLDMIDTIDTKIPHDLRHVWNKMKEGVYVSQKQKEKVMQIIEDVCGDFYE